MSSKRKRKKKLRKLMKKRDLAGVPALVVCVGKDCCARSVSKELVRDVRGYAEATHSHVRIQPVSCLHICKKGPIAATYPDIHFHKRVTASEAHDLVDEIERSRADDGR